MPSFIACKTTIGFGAPKKAGTNKVHGAALGAEETQGTRENLKWKEGAFVVPEEIKTNWEQTWEKTSSEYANWQKNYKASSHHSEL